MSYLEFNQPNQVTICKSNLISYNLYSLPSYPKTMINLYLKYYFWHNYMCEKARDDIYKKEGKPTNDENSHHSPKSLGCFFLFGKFG